MPAPSTNDSSKSDLYSYPVLSLPATTQSFKIRFEAALVEMTMTMKSLAGEDWNTVDRIAVFATDSEEARSHSIH